MKNLNNKYFWRYVNIGILILSTMISTAIGAESKPKTAAAPPASPATAHNATPHVSEHTAVATAHVTDRERSVPARHEAEAAHHIAEREHYAFHNRDVQHFDRVELEHWRAGRWNQSCYSGRCGWWWFSGGQSYFYDRPVYPYPLAVSEVTFVEPIAVVPAIPLATRAIIAPPPLIVAPPPQFLYYCDNPAGYYPAIPSCSAGFREVTGKH